MTPPTYEEGITAFLKLFRQTAPYKHRYEVFKDFVTMSACALHNSLLKEEIREQEYLKIIGGYKPDDQKRFPELLSLLVNLLQFEPKDVLGQLYMELEIANKDQGQFFSPACLSEVMAELVLQEPLGLMKDQEFVTLAEPACGAGGMVLALVKSMLGQKLDPAAKLWVECVDVDRLAALMCYIQLTLWNVPGVVIVGNSLTLETREVWYTPAHHIGFWPNKLARRRAAACSNDAPRLAQAQAGDEPTQTKTQESQQAGSRPDPEVDPRADQVPTGKPAASQNSGSDRQGIDVEIKREQFDFDF